MHVLLSEQAEEDYEFKPADILQVVVEAQRGAAYLRHRLRAEVGLHTGDLLPRPLSEAAHL